MADTYNDELLDWDSELENDGQQYVIVPPGDYTFTVTDVERANYNGSDKIPPCKMVTIKGTIDTDLGNATFQENLYLVRKQEWKLSAFFRCIGMKKHGEKLRMEWGKVPGARGKAKFKNELYKGNTYNRIDQFYDYEESTGFKPVQNDEELPW